MKIRNPFVIRSAAKLLAAVMRLNFATLRIEVRQHAPDVSPYAPTGDERYLYCIWHDAILGVLFSGRCRNLAGLASRHADGAYVAHAMEALGIPAVRGSSGKGGAAAIREIRRANEYHIAITTDGPRGPRREVKDGMIYLASRTGRPIVPVAFEAGKAWRPVGKWTDLVVPKPFGRAIIAGGKPITIPADIGRDDFDHWRGVVQSAMDSLNREVAEAMRIAVPSAQAAVAASRPAKAA